MRFLRNIALFCAVSTLIQCAGLRKKQNNDLELLVKITTPMGDMYAELSDKTPKHKANFVKLVSQGFYDSLMFHRVINGFMIQGGDPESKNAKQDAQLGNGGPGYTIPAEFDTTLYHQKGALAAARLGDGQNPKKESSGSQFYIAQGKVYSPEQLERIERSKQKTTPEMNMEEIPEFGFTKEQIESYTTVGGIPFLDQSYTVFGQIVEGIEVIDKIASVKVNKANGNRPVNDVRMKMELIYLSKEEKAKLLNKQEQ